MTNKQPKTNNLILKIKYKQLDLIVLFKLHKQILNLTTNKYELEPKLVNSLVLKALNKKLLKFFVIYGVYFDCLVEGLFIYSSDYLPDIEIDIKFTDLNHIISNWSKKAYKLIKKYVDVQTKNQFFLRYINEINKLSNNHLYKSASPKQLLGNAFAYFNRQGFQISNDFFKINEFDKCSKILSCQNWNFETLILELLAKCRNKALKIYYLDLQDLLLNSTFLTDFLEQSQNQISPQSTICQTTCEMTLKTEVTEPM